jgi:SAM-dependent methyltransferase
MRTGTHAGRTGRRARANTLRGRRCRGTIPCTNSTPRSAILGDCSESVRSGGNRTPATCLTGGTPRPATCQCERPRRRSRRGHRAQLPPPPASVTEVVAVEPEPRLRRIAQAEAADLSLNIRVRDSVASQLPLEDDSCDVGVASLVLCSVPAQGEALQELPRVIRPGGEPRFYEHVASPNRRLAHAQRLIDRLSGRRSAAAATAPATRSPRSSERAFRSRRFGGSASSPRR